MSTEPHPTGLSAVIAAQGRKPIWVARMLNVSESTLSRWASGERVIPAARIQELADLLGVDVDEIGALA